MVHHIGRPSPGMLDGFLRLEGASEAAILKFAKRWGGLGIMKYEEPDPAQWTIFPCPYQPGDVAIGIDKLAHWRHWVAAFVAAVEACSCLAASAPIPPPLIRTLALSGRPQGKRSDEERIADIHALLEYGSVERGSRTRAVVDRRSLSRDNRQFIWECLTAWVRIAGISIYLCPIKWQWRPYTPTLYSGLVSELVSALTDASGLAVCDGCQRAYRRNEPLRKTRRNYCAKCRSKNIPRRDATREWRNRTAAVPGRGEADSGLVKE